MIHHTHEFLYRSIDILLPEARMSALLTKTTESVNQLAMELAAGAEAFAAEHIGSA